MDKWKEPTIEELGTANELIKGFAAGKEIGGGDGLSTPEGQPVSGG